jgi:hypothetical protein
MKYYCVVTTEIDYVIEADSEEEAYEGAWDAAYADKDRDAAIVGVDVQKVIYQ